MANFSCNNREKKEYAKIKERLQKMSISDNFDVNLCLADMYAAVTRNLKSKFATFNDSRSNRHRDKKWRSRCFYSTRKQYRI